MGNYCQFCDKKGKEQGDGTFERCKLYEFYYKIEGVVINFVFSAHKSCLHDPNTLKIIEAT